MDPHSLIPEDRRIALLKCHIEDVENTLIENYPYLLRRVNIAIFELHSDKCDPDRCIELLDAAGLSYRKNVDSLLARSLCSGTIDAYPSSELWFST